MYYKSNNWFTLIEIIISIVISVIVLMFLFKILSDIIDEVSYNNNQSEILSSYNDFFNKLDGYKSVFLSGNLLIDNNLWIWNDVLMLKNKESTKWVLFWIVRKDTLKIEQNTGYLYIYDKVMAYREISDIEITDLETTPLNVYNYIFYEDKLFKALRIKDFQVDYYNSWNIININLWVNIWYIKWQNGELFTDIWTENIIKYNLNF